MGARAKGVVLLACASLLACAAASAATPVPKLASATVVGDRVTLTFTGALKPRVGAWTVLVNGARVTTTATFAGKRVQMRLPATVYSDDVVRVVGRNLRSAKGVRLRAFDVKPANRSTPGCSEQLGTVVPGVHREGPTDPGTFLPASRFRLYAVHVDFPDYPTRFTETMRFDGLDRSVRELSYGRSTVTGSGFPLKIRMLKNAAEYTHTGPWSARRQLLQDVLAQVDPTVDFREYDGLVVQMTLSGPGPYPRPAVDPYVIAPPGEGLAADGRELRHFFVGAPSVHSLLQVAGLPGMHWTEVAGWDRMYFAGGGQNLLAWHRRKLGWLLPTEARCLRDRPLDVALAPTWHGGGGKALIVPTSPTTAVVLENRQKQGVDAGICSRGVLPYRVDTQAPTSKIRMLHVDVPDGPCRGGYAPRDLAPGQKVTVEGVEVELRAIEADETYRLRVSRAR